MLTKYSLYIPYASRLGGLLSCVSVAGPKESKLLYVQSIPRIYSGRPHRRWQKHPSLLSGQTKGLTTCTIGTVSGPRASTTVYAVKRSIRTYEFCATHKKHFTTFANNTYYFYYYFCCYYHYYLHSTIVYILYLCYV